MRKRLLNLSQPRPVMLGDGLAPLDWEVKPSPEEAQFDAVRLKVTGTIEWGSTHSFERYVSYIASSQMFGAEGSPGRSYRSQLRKGGTVSGEITVWMKSKAAAEKCAPGQARFELTLGLNPTTTRALVIRRTPGDIEKLRPAQFFNPLPTFEEDYPAGASASPREVAVNDAANMLIGVLELGGTSVADRHASRDQFLATYEAQLKALILDAMCPPFLAPVVSEASCRAEALDGEVKVFLDWPHVALERAEVYWERRVSQPAAVVFRLCARGLDLARTIKVGKYAGSYSEEHRENGTTSLVIPLTGERNIELGVYAKSAERIRAEVRYQWDFSRHLTGVEATQSGRFPALLRRLSENAAKRLPWHELGWMAAGPQEAELADLPQLIEHLTRASRKEPSLMAPLVEGVLLSGGVTADEVRHPGIGAAVRALVRANVLARVSIQMKERRNGRRYALTGPYDAVRRKMLRGFAPEENIPATCPEDFEDDGTMQRISPIAGATKIATTARLTSGRRR